MSDYGKCQQALEFLRGIVYLNIGSTALYATEIQRIAGHLLFQTWVEERKEHFMALSEAQLVTLGADIAADVELNDHPNTLDGAFEIAKAYNTQASPDFYVWKTDYSTKDIRSNMVWDEYLTTSPDDKSTFELMISNGIVDMSNINVRAGMSEIFKNPGQANALAAIMASGSRVSTRLEKLFSTGVGTQADPATMTVEGNVTYQDVYKARNP